MTHKEILKKAYEVYPVTVYFNDNEHLFPLDANAEKREGYIKALTEIESGENPNYESTNKYKPYVHLKEAKDAAVQFEKDEPNALKVIAFLRGAQWQKRHQCNDDLILEAYNNGWQEGARKVTESYESLQKLRDE